MLSHNILTLLQLVLKQCSTRDPQAQHLHDVLSNFSIAYQSLHNMNEALQKSIHNFYALKNQVIDILKTCPNSHDFIDPSLIKQLIDSLDTMPLDNVYTPHTNSTITVSEHSVTHEKGMILLNQNHEIVLHNQVLFSFFPYLERAYYPLRDNCLKGISLLDLFDNHIKHDMYDTIWMQTATSHKDTIRDCLNVESGSWQEKLSSQHILSYVAHPLPEGHTLITLHTTPTTQIDSHKLAYMAYFDSLTHVMNRQFFLDRLNYLIQDKNTRMPLALLILDLDGFKDINDAYGHEMGDWLLKQVAQRLKTNIRQGDLLARFGGDEFVILLKNIVHHDSIRTIGERLLDSLQTPYARGDLSLKISASLGIASYPDDCTTSEDLLQYADKAMYSVKQNGKSGLCFYSDITQPKNSVMH